MDNITNNVNNNITPDMFYDKRPKNMFSDEKIARDSPKIEEEIKQIMKTLGLTDRLPTLEEMKQVTGSHSLDIKIKRTGGKHYWSRKLGVLTKYELRDLNYEKQKGERRELAKKEIKELSKNDFGNKKGQVTAEVNAKMMDFSIECINRKKAGITGAKIKTPEEMEEQIGEFMLFCKEHNLRPNMRKLALWLDYDYETFKKLTNIEYDRRYQIAKKYSEIFDEIIAENIANTTQPVGDIFIAKSRHGFIEADKAKEININVRNSTNINAISHFDIVEEIAGQPEDFGGEEPIDVEFQAIDSLEDF